MVLDLYFARNIKREPGGGFLHCIVRGEIQRSIQDSQMRRQLYPQHFYQSGTKVGGSKMIRYRRSPNRKLYRQEIGR
jgi:hypothetical protein